MGKKVIRLTESDLANVLKRILKEAFSDEPSLIRTHGGNYMMSSGRRRQSQEERSIYNIKSLVVELSHYKDEIGNSEISSEQKQSIRDYVESFIEGEFEMASENGVEDLTSLENIADAVKDKIYSMFSIGSKRLK